MHRCIITNDIHFLQRLLSNGANPNKGLNDVATPLVVAAQTPGSIVAVCVCIIMIISISKMFALYNVCVRIYVTA